MPLRVFLSYSHQDEHLRRQLCAHLSLLERQGVIETWHDRRILPGEAWAGKIDRSLRDADVVLCLVSPDFLASDYCFQVEMRSALAAHTRGQKTVVPIIARPVDWESSPLGELQALPRDAKPVTKWPNRDDAWYDVSRWIRVLAERLAARDTSAFTEPLPVLTLPDALLRDGLSQVLCPGCGAPVILSEADGPEPCWSCGVVLVPGEG
jgi:hypothetical protein